ncbi:MAG: GNAT family N-acetyltransferase [Chloroflexi bacterium]|nr:MAG: GNAT family N-acetyltransferase [Chloroflexota bacterium]
MTTSRKRSQFTVRELRTDAELSLCAQLDHTYLTDYVWQTDMREENDQTVVRFRSVRLPRTMSAIYPRDRDNLLRSWEKRDCFLVAASGDVLLGYINMRIGADRSKAWIQDLVIDKPFRRRRIASALLEQAARWASLHQIQHLTIEMQTKNFPGMQFARAQGFVFCGFNDHHYANQDIALFFGKNL